jgi:MFS-type transporter involved in bile tolerance (Atg22 family)
MDEKYYNMKTEEATETLAQSLQIGTVPQALFVVLLGFMYEIFGRKYVMFTLMVLTAFFVFILPVVSPSKNLFIAMNVCGSVTADPILLSPLI